MLLEGEQAMKNLARIFADSTEKFARNPFISYLVDDEVATFTFADVRRDVAAWAQLLKDQGVENGDRVAFLTPKSPHQIRLFYACWSAGAIAVPVCESLGELEMGFVLRDCEPKLVVVNASLKSKMEDLAGDAPVLTFDDMPLVDPKATAGDPCDLSVPDVEEDAVAAIIYTSGSTGMPKGVMLTHRNFIVNTQTALDAIRIRDDDSLISLLPYWHSFALVAEVMCTVFSGASVVVPADKRDFKKNIGRYQPTIILLVPRIAEALKAGILKKIRESKPFVQAMFDWAIHNASRIFTAGPRLDGGLLRMAAHHSVYDPLVFRKIRKAFGGRLRFFVSGGAPLDLEHQIFFKYIGAPIYQGYGLTESTPVISVNTEEYHRLGSSGRLLDWLKPENGGDYMFKDEQGNTAKDIKGELLVKGDCVMKGYWRHKDQSAKTLADGWLHTGDMGYVDEDGFIFLEGRQGNMIVLVGGEKLHPEHVEDRIKSDDLIPEAMVIGEGCKNVYALVNLDPDLAEKMPETELLNMVRQRVKDATSHLAAYQKPKDVMIIPPLSVEDGTLTVTLKVRRHKVWERDGNAVRDFLRSCGEDIGGDTGDKADSARIMRNMGWLNGNSGE
jgi:long-chain acyl-CoA synthetase